MEHIKVVYFSSNRGKSCASVPFEQSESVLSLRERISDALSPDSRIELLYHGKLLRDEVTVSECGLTNGTLMTALRARDFNTSIKGNRAVSEAEVVRVLNSIVLSSTFQVAFEEFHSDLTLFAKLISFTPALADDPFVQDVLKDPTLLDIYFEEDNLPRLLKEHPTFSRSVVYMATMMKRINKQKTVMDTNQGAEAEEEGDPFESLEISSVDPITSQLSRVQARSGPSSGRGAGSVSNNPRLTGPSQSGPSTRGDPAAGSTAAQPVPSAIISPDFLMAALRQVRGEVEESGVSRPDVNTGVSRPDVNTGAQQQQQPQPQQQLPQQSLVTAETGPSQGAISSDVGNFDSQIAQLKAMDIDEDVAKSVLESTGGNLDMAIELLYGDQH